jgi:crotonobetainyl-CoA:carnitine CoA-transferase CaiB-like acyl-CoA transferase
MAKVTRSLPQAFGTDIGVGKGNRAVIYAAHWLELLGGRAPANKAKIMIVAGSEDTAAGEDADCLIRLWDFQVRRDGSGALASAVSGASSVIGHPDKAPLFLPADMPEKWCGVYGVILALAELWAQRNGGADRRVVYDVSAADILRSFSLQNAGTPEDMAKNWRRNGRLCVEHGGIFPMGFFACKDGHVAILGRSRRDWRNIRMALGDPEWAKAPEFENPFAIARDSATADRQLEQTLAQFDRDELLARGLEHGAVIAPVFSTEQAHDRNVFRHGFLDNGTPALPFLATAHKVEEALPVAPAAPAIAAADAPLAGMRCMEMCWVWSGPMVGQILADLGAQVIKVESHGRFDLYRTRGLEAKRGRMPEPTRLESSRQFHSLNRNKIGMTLDLKQEAGLKVAKRLAAESDVLIENFTVGTMARLGLGAPVLAKANPALVQLSMSGPGKGSAVQELRSYGLVLSALAGAEMLICDGDEFLGSPTFSMSDPNAAAFGAMAALAGVLAAQAGGTGCAIDLSQIEAAATIARIPTPVADTCNAIVRAADEDFVAVSLPATQALPSNLDGAAFAEITASAEQLGGHAVKVLDLPQTEGSDVFSDCSGWLPSTHPYTGYEMLVASPWRINGQRPGLRKPAPLLGEGDDYVLRRVLNMADEEIGALAVAGVSGGNRNEQ